MLRLSRWAIWLVCLVLLAASLNPAFAAASSELTIEKAAIGFDGRFKIGMATPLTLSLSGSVPETFHVDVVTADPAGAYVTTRTSFSGSQSSAGEFQVVCQAGRIDSTIEVRVLDAKHARLLDSHTIRPGVDDAPLALKLSEHLVLTLGNPAGFAAPDDEAADGPRVHAIALEKPGDLPASPSALQAVDVIVLADQFELTEDQNDVVRAWVLDGGHLVIATGTKGESLGRSLLAKWLPFEVIGTMRLRDLSALENFAGQTERIEFGRVVNATRIQSDDAKPLIPTLDGPLLSRAAHGFGRVTFLTLDLNAPPLAKWSFVEQFVPKLIDAPRAETAVAGRAERSQLTHTGITDLASQLAGSLEHFETVQRLTSWHVMGWLGLYVLLIGPLDYLLVHRLLKRPALTWVTFPTIVVVAGLLAVVSAERVNGSQLLINRLEIVDVDARTETVRASGFSAIYSPKTQRYKLEVKPATSAWSATASATPPSTMQMQWFGIPETSYGGMYRGGGFELGRTSYRMFENGHGIEDLPIAVWSTRTIQSRSFTEPSPHVESHLRSIGNQLSGTFSHSLPVPISNWILAHGRQVFWSPSSDPNRSKILPHQVWDTASSNVRSRDLTGLLTRSVKSRVKREGSDDNIRTQQSVYDPLSLDAAQIVRMLTFHDAVGGRDYTGLTNTELARLDFTRFLALNTAVLVGRIDTPAGNLLLDGTPVTPTRHETFIRILLPVDSTGPVRTQLTPRPEDLEVPQ